MTPATWLTVTINIVAVVRRHGASAERDPLTGRLGRDPAAGLATMTRQLESNRDIVRRYLKAFNDRDRDTMSDLLDDDVVEHGIHEELHGVEEILDFLDAHFDTFEDYSGTTQAIVAEDDLVTVRYEVSGTHVGEYRDVTPTGKRVAWTGMAMYRIEDGQIAEIWLEENRLGLLEQLDVVDPPAHLRI
jgi:steroid delta-isomerase-like uncharacterized protein